MIQILLILIGLSSLSMANFSKSGNIVTDSSTGLQWQDDAIGTTTTWQGAIDRCEALVLDTHDDWRLPNKNELISIVDYSLNNPSIDSQFQNTISYYYWSSTSNASYPSYAWYVYFYDGSTYYSNKFNSKYVRCVRAGQ